MYGDSNWMEPDIDGRNANGDPVEYDYKTQSYQVIQNDTDRYVITEPHYLYQFTDKESLMSSAVFQECLSKSLAFKDKTIRDLQNELLNMGSII